MKKHRPEGCFNENKQPEKNRRLYAGENHHKLAKHLDNLPGGFPPTDTGVELRILERLFTPEEAEFAMHLALIPENAKVIARRAKLSVADTAQRLEKNGPER